jgi:CRISPR-associated protein Csb1
MTEPRKFPHEEIHLWADDPKGPVALVLRQRLIPVEGENGVIFPPTYAGIGYNIDPLADGTLVALVDSVGAQANRIEPIFKRSVAGQPENPVAKLVPQIDITYKNEKGTEKTLSLLDAGHRLGDAIVRSSAPRKDAEVGPENKPWNLAHEARKAFEAHLDPGDASHIAKIAPTSLVFGVWDSRDTEAKLPRLVQSTIRAWDVTELKRSAQFNPVIDFRSTGAFSEKEVQKAEKSAKDPLAQRGYVHVPATEQHGGVVVHGEIIREVTVNLVALRRLRGDGKNDTQLRRYILGLSLVAAAEPMDAFLRQGCLITPDPDAPAHWELVDRKGSRSPIELDEALAFAYAERVASDFGVGKDRQAVFDKGRAKTDAAVTKNTNS